LDIPPPKKPLEDVCKKQGERLHQDISAMDTLYHGEWTICWLTAPNSYKERSSKYKHEENKLKKIFNALNVNAYFAGILHSVLLNKVETTCSRFTFSFRSLILP
jgi:hypothetical protein